MKKIVLISLMLSIIACLGSGAVVVYVVCAKGAIEFSLGEGMIGIIVALLAVLVTIILGWQIYTAIDIKEKIAAIDEVQSKQNNQEHRMEQMYYNSCRVIDCAMSAIDNGHDPVHSFRWILSALAFSLKMDKPTDIEKLLVDLKHKVGQIKENSTLEANFIKEIKEYDKSIRESASFSCFASQYESIYSEFQKKVSVEKK